MLHGEHRRFFLGDAQVAIFSWQPGWWTVALDAWELWNFLDRDSNEEEGHQPMLFRHALWSPNKSIPKNVPKNVHAAPKKKQRSTKRSRWFHRKYRPSWCLEGSKGAAASFLSTHHSRVFNKIPFDAFRLPNACFEEKTYLWFRFTTPLTVGKSFVHF